MTEWNPDTCGCFVEIESGVLINQCTIHKSVREVLRHNNILNLAFNELDSPKIQQQDVLLAKKTYYEKRIEDQTLIDKFKSFFRL